MKIKLKLARKVSVMMATALLVQGFATTAMAVDQGSGFEKIAAYSTGFTDGDGGIAEIVKYNSDNKKFYLVNGKTSRLDVVSLEEMENAQNGVTALEAQLSIDLTALLPEGFAYGDLTSVDVDTQHDVIAVAVQEADFVKAGKIAILDYDGNLVKWIDAGVQPDMVVFTPDYQHLLVANEGEPRDGYVTEDPKGSVTLVDLTDGIEAATAANLYFDAYDAARESLIQDSVILKKDAAPSQDLEPEYIAVSQDGKKAYVSLQEANAIATVDIENKTFASVKGLGFKNHSLPGNELDLISDGEVKIESQQVYGAYMPDGIALAEIAGKSYILTANEGDDREWGEDADGEPVYANADKIKINDKKVTVLVNEMMDGLEADKTYILGGRSFSIWDAQTMDLVYDSGSEFESVIASQLPMYFNCSNDTIEMEDRSGKKGPEPEDVKVGQIGGRFYAWIGLERVGGIMTYDITNPENPLFANYSHTRDFSGDIVGDVSPEGLSFVADTASPDGQPLLIAAYEVSGTAAVYQLDGQALRKESLTNGLNPIMTRGDAALMLSRAGGSMTGTTTTSFTDVKIDASYGQAVAWAADNQIVNGMGSGRFMPQASITREQFSLMLTRYAQHQGIELQAIQNIDLKNAAAISAWAKESAMTLGNSGAFEVWGIQEDFQPQAPVTLEEAAVLMMWLLEQK